MAGFSRGKVTDNEMAHPGYGVTVAYHGGERGEATVYVYNKGQQDIADGPSRKRYGRSSTRRRAKPCRWDN